MVVPMLWTRFFFAALISLSFFFGKHKGTDRFVVCQTNFHIFFFIKPVNQITWFNTGGESWFYELHRLFFRVAKKMWSGHSKIVSFARNQRSNSCEFPFIFFFSETRCCDTNKQTYKVERLLGIEFFSNRQSAI